MPKKDKPTISYLPTLITKKPRKDWDDLVALFKKKFDCLPDEQDGMLIFSSQEAAISFFKEQAQAGYVFFVTEYVNKAPSGFHIFSCGDGMAYEGTLKEIEAQLKATVAQDPQNKKAAEGLLTLANAIQADALAKESPTSKMRESLQASRTTNDGHTPSSSVPKNTR